jgi:hypothetical protein
MAQKKVLRDLFNLTWLSGLKMNFVWIFGPSVTPARARSRAVLQMLRRRDDVAGEMALLVEDLGTAGDTTIEEYMVGPPSRSTW